MRPRVDNNVTSNYGYMYKLFKKNIEGERMNTLKKEISEYGIGIKYPILKRIKAGRIILIIAALPLMSVWMTPIGAIMAMTLSPQVWAKSKIIDLKEWRRL